LQGADALAFLRTRHGVGDGSDLGRISNQQVFLSSLMRTIKSADTLSNPGKVYGIAKAAISNMKFSEGFNSVPTLASMAFALKDINLNKVVFVQYPTFYQGDGVEPQQDAADQLFTALSNDTPITLTGTTGVGSEADPNAPAGSSTPAAPPATDGSTTASTSGSSVALPDSVHGQTANQYTCSKPYDG
jgi:hypothetical protein